MDVILNWIYPSLLATFLVLHAGVALGDENRKQPIPVMRLFDRPHTIAELEAGIIALPDAPISAAQKGGETPFGAIGRGDATLQTGLHVLYRGSPEWAIGAGLLFGPSPTRDTVYGGQGSLTRTQSRSYLLLGTEGRYMAIRSAWVEGWIGLTVGGVIIADRFRTVTKQPPPPLLGTSEVTVHTDGFAIGAQAGLGWMFAERWVAGATARLDRWFLPETPKCTPIGDCATLSGSVGAVELGLSIGYRIPL